MRLGGYPPTIDSAGANIAPTSELEPVALVGDNGRPLAIPPDEADDRDPEDRLRNLSLAMRGATFFCTHGSPEDRRRRARNAVRARIRRRGS